ncbi:MAG: hypothetical protein H6Q98_559 [Nitrospirae bacterium]|nr:hypothetical protein [Nitrospirota bacterium]
MKNSIAKKGAYIGAGAGLVLFAIFGLLPGSLLGGAMGINIAGWMFGLPLPHLPGHRAGVHAGGRAGLGHRDRDSDHHGGLAGRQAA